MSSISGVLRNSLSSLNWSVMMKTYLWSSWFHKTQRQSPVHVWNGNWALYQWAPGCSWSISNKTLLCAGQSRTCLLGPILCPSVPVLLSLPLFPGTHTRPSQLYQSPEFKFLRWPENMLNIEEGRRIWPGKEKSQGSCLQIGLSHGNWFGVPWRAWLEPMGRQENGKFKLHLRTHFLISAF